jgi:hypothetical protein
VETVIIIVIIIISINEANCDKYRLFQSKGKKFVFILLETVCNVCLNM